MFWPSAFRLFLYLNIERVAWSFTNDFHRVRLGIAPNCLPRFGCNRLRFSIRRRELERASRQPVNRMMGMRMHRAFIAGLLADVYDAHVFVIQQHFVMLRVDFCGVLRSCDERDQDRNPKNQNEPFHYYPPGLKSTENSRFVNHNRRAVHSTVPYTA